MTIKKIRKIELLAPAKNLECGIAAIDHGADAVYIGAPKHGARAAASNSLEDIQQLVEYAHLFNAKIYVTVNTILKDDELASTKEMIWSLYEIKVDAIIAQDMALMNMTELPPIPFHASTQMDNRDSQKVRFLSDVGFQQVVLARELSLNQISKIHRENPETNLEVFVHGALCVSYSGQCYVSELCFGRSANRGECAQFCRHTFNLIDSEGTEIIQNKHLLSLKDMCRINQLEDLLEAGVTSLKIEGRLKDVNYVKNVTAAYRLALDKIFKRREEFVPSSSGTVDLTFTPDLYKSFSRGFTDYFLRKRTNDIYSFDTPKSLGEEMGRVKELRHRYFTVAGLKDFNNGDGACFIDENGKLQGFRINRVEENRIFPHEMPDVLPKTVLYRNYDQAFDKLLSQQSSTRKIDLSFTLTETADGFLLETVDEDSNKVSVPISFKKEPARSPQEDNIKRQFSKLGNTPFILSNITVNLSDNWFIPASLLAEARREACDKLLNFRKDNYSYTKFERKLNEAAYPTHELTYLGNVMNEEAKDFYLKHGVSKIDGAFELNHPENVPLMFCKHCLRFALGYCPTHHKKKSPYVEPLFLESHDGNRFKLEFDCKRCQMKVIKEE